MTGWLKLWDEVRKRAKVNDIELPDYKVTRAGNLPLWPRLKAARDVLGISAGS